MDDLGVREDPAPEEPLLLAVEIDWRAYFIEFESLHGGNPVIYKKTQFLYADGFRYSNSDYAGPEYAAPTDPVELRKLQKVYWSVRRAKLQVELGHAKNLLSNLREEQRKRSATLQCRVTKLDENDKQITVVQAIDWPLLEMKVKTLSAELSRAEEELQTL